MLNCPVRLLNKAFVPIAKFAVPVELVVWKLPDPIAKLDDTLPLPLPIV